MINYTSSINEKIDYSELAISERITNSIDSLLLKKCIESGIDPRSQSAPQSMPEAIEKFYNIPKGRLINYTDDYARKI